MSERLQYDLHPDADQISAFVEQALPAHEREQMLDHLAVCPECRAIVALSLPELEETPVPQPARKPWWSGWVLAWPLAGAVAAVTFFLVYMHRVSISNQVPAQQQVAVSHPPAPAASVEQSPANTRKQELRNSEPRISGPRISRDRGPDSVTKAVERTKSDAKNPAQAVGGPALTGRNFAALMRPSQATALKAPGASGGEHGVGFTSGRGAALSFAPSSAVAGQMQKMAPIQPAGTAIGAAPLQTAEAAVPSPSGGAGVTGAAPMPAGSSNLANFEIPADQAELKQIRQALPSRLPILSMATEGQRIVAIDTHNAVFLSDDAGGHWTPILAPWLGRAVKAGLVVAPAESRTEYGADKSPSLKAPPALGRSLNNALSTPVRPPSALPGPSLAGTVTDPSGAAIPGASVVATDGATGTAQTVVTDSTGQYRFHGLATGKYRVEARAPGFMKQELLAVVAGSEPTAANLTLNIGAASQTVTVEAAAQGTIATQTLPPESQQTPVFEIITENGERWTSTDGMTWNQMEPHPEK
jgi:Carboxypeptidase regulatory-like domain/Putative zinc-finger